MRYPGITCVSDFAATISRAGKLCPQSLKATMHPADYFDFVLFSSSYLSWHQTSSVTSAFATTGTPLSLSEEWEEALSFVCRVTKQAVMSRS